jgi:nicotinate phosphoribosyltransferase
MSFSSEQEAFRRLQDVLGPHTIQLVDTYDPIEGTRRAAALGRPLWGIRLDSGDFLALSKQARAILDAAGLPDAKIMASGDLDERRIGELVEAGAPIDVFGVGTELATSADAPSMGAIYKLVEVNGRPTAKWSEDKASLPGAKQLFRFPDHDVLALAEEPCPPGAEALLLPVIRKGQLVKQPPIRKVGQADSLPVLHSEALIALVDRMRMERK